MMKVTAEASVNYRDDGFAITTDLRNPYLNLGRHPEWCSQFEATVNNPKVHALLSKKLSPFAPYIIHYSKIKPDPERLRELCELPSATICVITGIGEHGITSWMILHNIGHTLISNHIRVKKGFKTILGYHDKHNVRIHQRDLVTCASSRKAMIPNVNELIYELFTTWLWFGETQSPHSQLRAYCDQTFARLMSDSKGTMFWHRYRSASLASLADVDAIRELTD